MESETLPLEYDLSKELKKIIEVLQKRDPQRAEILRKKIKQISNSDETTIEHFKNLKGNLSFEKRVHIDKSFVLTFQYDKNKKFILFLDFDHHDNIYK